MMNSELVEIRRLRSLHDDDRICDGVRGQLRDLLHEFVARDYFDDRHVYIRDGRTLEERRQHYRRMKVHYKQVMTTLLELLS